MSAPEYVVQIRLDAARHVLAGSVTTFVDERESYRVEPVIGPFDTWGEVLAVLVESLDRQLELWEAPA